MYVNLLTYIRKSRILQIKDKWLTDTYLHTLSFFLVVRGRYDIPNRIGLIDSLVDSDPAVGPLLLHLTFTGQPYTAHFRSSAR